MGTVCYLVLTKPETFGKDSSEIMKKKWSFCSVELFFREGKFDIKGL